MKNNLIQFENGHHLKETLFHGRGVCLLPNCEIMSISSLDSRLIVLHSEFKPQLQRLDASPGSYISHSTTPPPFRLLTHFLCFILTSCGQLSSSSSLIFLTSLFLSHRFSLSDRLAPRP